jgi:phage terminase large subunit-like protein
MSGFITQVENSAALSVLALQEPLLYAEALEIDQQRNYASEREICEGSLIEFCKRAWREIVPGQMLVNWHHEEMCKYLEAISYGELRDLIINIPPRHGKSLICSIFWPAWMWCLEADPNFPLIGPQVRFLCVSYGAKLSWRHALDFKRLIEGEWYQSLWGDRVRVRSDQQSREDVAIYAGGERISNSIAGGIMGRGGDITICFPASELVLTEHGHVPIGEIVNKRMPIKVWSVSVGGQIELRPIVGWHKNPGSKILRISFDGGSVVRCTPNHRFLTSGGWLRAEELTPNDLVWTAGIDDSALYQRYGLVANAVHLGQRPVADLAFADIANLGAGQLGFGVARALGVTVGVGGSGGRPLATDRDAIGLVDFEMFPSSFVPADIPDCFHLDAHTGSDRSGAFGTSQNFDCLRLCEFGGAFAFSDWELPMRESVGDIFFSRSIREARQHWFGFATINVPDLLMWRGFSQKSPRDKAMDFDREAFVVSPQFNAGISSSVYMLGKEFSPNLPPSFVDARHTVYTTQIRNLIPRKSRHASPRLARIVSITDDGHSDSTFCLTISRNGTMVMGDAQVVAANCDDPHNLEGAESELQRTQTLKMFSEALTTRVTNPAIHAQVLVMQRLHDMDVTSWALENWPADTVHLMYPARFEIARAVPTDHRTYEGELLWPDLWPEEELRKIELGLVGPEGKDSPGLSAYAVAGQLQQSPRPREGGIIDIRDWAIYPETLPDPKEVVLSATGEIVLGLPPVSYVVVVCDTAMSEEELTSFNACLVFGIWHRRRNFVATTQPWFAPRWQGARDPADEVERIIEEDEQPRVILMEAWRRRCKLNDDTLDNLGRPQGLVQRLVDTARRRKADKIIIENKTRAKDVTDEMYRQFRREAALIELWNPTGHGDKVNRLHSVQPLFGQGLVYAPGHMVLKRDHVGQQYVDVEEFVWVNQVVNEVAQVPRGRYSDLADCVSMGLTWLRENGFLHLSAEFIADTLQQRQWQPKRARVREVYGV